MVYCIPPAKHDSKLAWGHIEMQYQLETVGDLHEIEDPRALGFVKIYIKVPMTIRGIFMSVLLS